MFYQGKILASDWSKKGNSGISALKAQDEIPSGMATPAVEPWPEVKSMLPQGQVPRPCLHNVTNSKILCIPKIVDHVKRLHEPVKNHKDNK